MCIRDRIIPCRSQRTSSFSKDCSRYLCCLNSVCIHRLHCIPNEGTRSALPNPIPQIQKEIANMKSLRIALPLLLSFAATAAFAQISAQKSFDQLKSLAGSWEGKDSKGRPLRVSFRDMARGSALMSEIQKKGSDAVMISMISMI